MATVLGFIAAFCTTAAFIPQALKVHKSRQTGDISYGMTFLMTFGVFAWLVYGIMIYSFPLIAANLITFILSSYILVMKLKLG